MNAFHWQGQPSAVAESLRPHPKDRTVNLAPRRMHIYQAVKVDPDRDLEAQIEQTNREVERHFMLAQSGVLSNDQHAIHRDEARRLAAKVKALVALRSPEYVAQLEQERGIG